VNGYEKLVVFMDKNSNKSKEESFIDVSIAI